MKSRGLRSCTASRFLIPPPRNASAHRAPDYAALRGADRRRRPGRRTPAMVQGPHRHQAHRDSAQRLLLCSTIMQDEALVVNDARQDIRFANLPCPRGPCLGSTPVSRSARRAGTRSARSACSTSVPPAPPARPPRAQELGARRARARAANRIAPAGSARGEGSPRVRRAYARRPSPTSRPTRIAATRFSRTFSPPAWSPSCETTATSNQSGTRKSP